MRQRHTALRRGGKHREPERADRDHRLELVVDHLPPRRLIRFIRAVIYVSWSKLLVQDAGSELNEG